MQYELPNDSDNTMLFHYLYQIVILDSPYTILYGEREAQYLCYHSADKLLYLCLLRHLPIYDGIRHDFVL